LTTLQSLLHHSWAIRFPLFLLIVFAGVLGVLPKSLFVLLMQVAVSQQVAAAEPEVEDDELSNTMLTVPF